MLALSYVVLRFLHFGALMLTTGAAASVICLTYGQFAKVMQGRLLRFGRPVIGMSALAATLMLFIQGGLMGQGWPDTINPAIWRAVVGTHFGQIWIWQILLAWISVVISIISLRYLSLLLLWIGIVQIILLADIGHSGAHGGILVLTDILHLLAATWWIGGLLPLLIGMQMANKPRWRRAAVHAMLRFSQYGHLAVVMVIIAGIANAVLIAGWPPAWGSGYVQLLLFKCGLVALMVFIALVNRYWLVPRFSKCADMAHRYFIRMTILEFALGMGAIACVSLFATWQPF